MVMLTVSALITFKPSIKEKEPDKLIRSTYICATTHAAAVLNVKEKYTTAC
jgi:hypothetical protein